MSWIPQARIIHDGYQNLCMCDRPILPESGPIDREPKFNFKAAVREYAANNGLSNVQFNRIDKSAIAELAIPCAHRPIQYVRIGYRLDWKEQ